MQYFVGFIKFATGFAAIVAVSLLTLRLAAAL